MIILMLDFDGTLAPVVNVPTKSTMSGEMRRALAVLAKRDDFAIAVISGRGLPDVKAKVKLKNIYYAGCHGFEMAGPGWSYRHPQAKKIAAQTESLAGYLNGRLARVKGCVVENKGYALTVHYRMVKPAFYSAVREAVRKGEKEFKGRLRMEPGRMIYEFKPAIDWGKDRAVEILLELYRTKDPYPIYIGDDLTDESVFELLKGRGLTILVDNSERPKRSSAVLRFSSVNQVYRFIRSLC